MYHFIVNKKSSSGKGTHIWANLEKELKEHKVPFQVHFTQEAGHASRLASHLTTGTEPLTIIAVGGDGTANEVINGMVRFSNVTFGYIPTGSSNDLARGLGLSSNPKTALYSILKPSKYLSMYIGKNTSGEESRSFAVSSGIGFDAAVCFETFHSKIKKVLNKIHLGKLTYTGIALKRLLMLKPVPMTLTMDDQKPISFDGIYFIAGMNLKYEGGGFMFCPGANPSDEYLDLCVVEKIPKLKVLFILPLAFKGKHVNVKGIHIYRCKKAQIQSSIPSPVHTDGELFQYRSDITLSLHEKPLRTILN